jgi:hypothetical protein
MSLGTDTAAAAWPCSRLEVNITADKQPSACYTFNTHFMYTDTDMRSLRARKPVK